MFPTENVNRLRGSRVRALELAYGSVSDDVDQTRELQTQSVTVPLLGWVPALRMSGDVAARAALTDMSAPEIGVLLGLARAADAVELRTPGQVFDVGVNAATLLRASEQRVRRLEPECSGPGMLPPFCTVGASEDPDDYLIAERFGIRLQHARALVRALIELVFGLPSQGDTEGDLLDYGPEATGDNRSLALPYDLPERISGHHVANGFVGEGGSMLHLDPAFAVRGGARSVQQHTWAYVPPAELRLDNTINPWLQGGFGISMSDSSGQLGTVPTLVYARHTLLRAGITGPLYERAKAALAVLDASIGPRSVLIRPATAVVPMDFSRPAGFVQVVPLRSADMLGGLRYEGASCETCPIHWRSATRYQLEVYRKPQDPFAVDRAAALNEVLEDSSSFTTCTGGAASSCLLPLPPSSTTSVEGGELVASQLDLTADHQLVELRSSQTDDVVLRGKLDVGAPRFVQLAWEQSSFGRAMSFGGSLNAQIERAWQAQEDDWSKPGYDAFGLPRNWTPSADASLAGGGPNEEQYRYFLRAAKDAAGSATRALSAAADALIAEAGDDLALQSAEERGATLEALELQGLCGTNVSCDPLGCDPEGASSECPRSSLSLRLCPAGSLRTDTLERCGAFIFQLRDVLGSAIDDDVGVVLAQAVVDQLDRSTPDFSAYAGGQLEGLLFAQWSAWKELQGALDGAMASTLSTLEAVHAAQDQDAAAEADWEAAKADVAWTYDELERRGISIQASRDAYDEDIHALEIGNDAADAMTEVACNADAQKRADLSERAFNKSGDTESFTVNNGAFYSWQQACAEATQTSASAKVLNNMRIASLDVLTAGLDDQLALIDAELDGRSLEARVDAAAVRWTAAGTRLAAAHAEVERQTYVELMGLQAAFERVLASGAAIRTAVASARLAVAKVELEQELAASDIKSRFGLRRRFQSYDLWRARALSENARRLCVAARRSIESRFVVNLSDLDGPEPFVEAPAVWSDEIYEPDLKPTAALGTTASSASAGGVAINKLEDYVTNLGLFVDGYTVARPTVEARAEVESIQLPGPAAIVRGGAMQGGWSYIDPASSGWRFYCEQTGTWLPHPDVGALEPQSWDLSTACFGEAPTKARLGFWLDPWGRPYGHYVDPPFRARHNARWRRLAVNLVGAAIRDCERAADEEACLSEPFIRYSIRHVGPAWVTNHEEQWRALDIPAAVIEAGKALTTEEWVDPIANGFNAPAVAVVARRELGGRPLGGAYELELELTPDVQVERIDRLQLLAEVDYWVRQETGTKGDSEDQVRCGDGVVEAPELCDGSCPTTCPDDGVVCTADILRGQPTVCSAECVHEPIDECASGDGCCPSSCTVIEDADCAAPPAVCGNGIIEETETCDGDCPSSCNDVDLCTTDVLTGTASACNTACGNTAIGACVDGDGCCPFACDGSEDSDCSPLQASSPESIFGDSVVEWWDSRLGTALVSGGVGTWFGQKQGIALEASTPLQRPSYGADANLFGGYPVVKCTGAEQGLEALPGAPYLAAGTRPYFAFVGRLRAPVVQPSGAGLLRFDHVPVGAVADSELSTAITSDQRWGVAYRWNGETPQDKSLAPHDTSQHVFEYASSASTGVSLYVDGVLVARNSNEGVSSAYNALFQALDRIDVCGGALAQSVELSLAEIVLLEAQPSRAQRNAYLTHARDLWGVPCAASDATGCLATDCGDAIVQAGESCDPGPAHRTATCDTDCTARVCGDHRVNPLAGETCDGDYRVGERCPSSCDDGLACTVDTLVGSAVQCTAMCQHTPFVSQATTCGVGACVRAGTVSCVGGALIDSCVPGMPTPDADCDGVDDDCDGQNDDGYVPLPTTCGPPSTSGTTSCVEGVVYDSCDPDLVGRWSFSEGSGTTTADSSPSGVTASLLGATAWTPNGRRGSALYFDGSTSRVSIPNGAWNTGKPITYSVWFKPKGSAQGALIEHRQTGGIPSSFFIWSAAQFSGYDSLGTDIWTPGYAPPPPSVWAMITVVITSTQVTLYKNGAVVGSIPASGGLNAISGPLYLGARGEVPDNFFRGYIDELSIYRRAFSASEVLTLFRSYGTTQDDRPQLTGRRSFDEGSGTTSADLTGLGNHAVVETATWDPNGRAGACLFVNGTNGVVTLPDGEWDNGAPATYSIWYKTSGAAQGELLDHRHGANNAGAFALQAPGPIFDVYVSSSQSVFLQGIGAPSSGTWMMVTAVVAPSEVRLYQNGVRVRTVAAPGPVPYIPGPLYLGARGLENDRFFRGWMDDLVIYRRALTDAEVLQLYTNPGAPPP
jgi:hypothetical protein